MWHFLYCPYKTTDKAVCERLHNLVRYFLPKGHSLDTLNQEDVDEMYSHINLMILLWKAGTVSLKKKHYITIKSNH